MPPWLQDFEAYHASVDSDPGSFLVDLAGVEHAPLPGYDRRIHVRVTMQFPRADGLRAVEEIDMLAALEQRIVDRLADRWAAVFLGHVISGGSLHIICYGPSAAIVDEAALLDGFDPGGYELAWYVVEEPHWDFYVEFLYPADLDFHLIHNRRELELRVERGDDPRQERRIDHTALFEDRGAGETAGAALGRLGYRISGLALLDEVWTLQFYRDDRLNGDAADRFCVEIIDVVETYGGVYEGWQARIVPFAPM